MARGLDPEIAYEDPRMRLSETTHILPAMATVSLRAPLQNLTGGAAEIEVGASTVGDAIRQLEAEYPKLTGWILDEQGHIRRHVNIFVNGERMREDAKLSPSDRLHVLPSISGGSR